MQGSPRVAVRLCVFASAFLFLTNITPASAQTRTAPGGFVESATSTATRPMGSASTWQNLLPQRGEFQFPSPYNTRGIRITNPSDCGGGDCVRPIGYSYWRNTNNHVGSDTILIAVALDRRSGGTGPTLFTYSKSTGATRNAGPIFDSSHALSWGSGEG